MFIHDRLRLEAFAGQALSRGWLGEVLADRLPAILRSEQTVLIHIADIIVTVHSLRLAAGRDQDHPEPNQTQRAQSQYMHQ